MPSNKKLAILEKRNFIFKKLKTYIDGELNSAQCNIYDPWKKDFQERKTIDEI